MKVLLRNFGGELYVWKDAEYTDGRIKVDDTQLQETDIVSIIDDNRNEYVKCSYCGQIIKNTPEEIEKHRKRYLDYKTCLNCHYKRERIGNTLSDTYSYLDNGKFARTVQTAVTLTCANRGWYDGPNITSETARSECRYRACKNADMNGITDIFTEHPGVFDHIVTSDKIIEAGYKARTHSRNYTSYALKGRNQIYAMVNDLNILDHFVIAYHNNEWRSIYYSKLTDELYDGRNGTYKVWRPDMSESTRRYIKNRIAELYA